MVYETSKQDVRDGGLILRWMTICVMRDVASAKQVLVLVGLMPLGWGWVFIWVRP